MMRIAIVLSAAGCLLAGCRAGTSHDAEQIKGVVKEYNRLLAKGYAGLSMVELGRVATPEQATKVYYHMAALGEARVKVLSELKDVRFGKLAFVNTSTAAVGTRELWDFRHVNIDNGAVTLKQENYPYTLDYRLRKRDGKWLVLSVANLEDTAAAKGK